MNILGGFLNVLGLTSALHSFNHQAADFNVAPTNAFGQTQLSPKPFPSPSVPETQHQQHPSSFVQSPFAVHLPSESGVSSSVSPFAVHLPSESGETPNLFSSSIPYTYFNGQNELPLQVTQPSESHSNSAVSPINHPAARPTLLTSALNSLGNQNSAAFSTPPVLVTPSVNQHDVQNKKLSSEQHLPSVSSGIPNLMPVESVKMNELTSQENIQQQRKSPLNFNTELNHRSFGTSTLNEQNSIKLSMVPTNFKLPDRKSGFTTDLIEVPENIDVVSDIPNHNPATNQIHTMSTKSLLELRRNAKLLAALGLNGEVSTDQLNLIKLLLEAIRNGNFNGASSIKELIVIPSQLAHVSKDRVPESSNHNSVTNPLNANSILEFRRNANLLAALQRLNGEVSADQLNAMKIALDYLSGSGHTKAIELPKEQENNEKSLTITDSKSTELPENSGKSIMANSKSAELDEIIPLSSLPRVDLKHSRLNLKSVSAIASFLALLGRLKTIQSKPVRVSKEGSTPRAPLTQGDSIVESSSNSSPVEPIASQLKTEPRAINQEFGLRSDESIASQLNMDGPSSGKTNNGESSSESSSEKTNNGESSSTESDQSSSGKTNNGDSSSGNSGQSKNGESSSDQSKNGGSSSESSDQSKNGESSSESSDQSNKGPSSSGTSSQQSNKDESSSEESTTKEKPNLNPESGSENRSTESPNSIKETSKLSAMNQETNSSPQAIKASDDKKAIKKKTNHAHSPWLSGSLAVAGIATSAVGAALLGVTVANEKQGPN